MKNKTLAIITAIFISGAAQAQKDTTIQIDKVTVTATRMNLPLKSVPQKVEIIPQSLIEVNPSENLGEILKRTTNLDIIQYPGALVTIGMRGFPATAHSRSYTLILIDGKPSGTNNLATIPADIIDRIEVVKGPYSVQYGSDAMGGVINIITRTPTAYTSGKAGISFGSFGQTSIAANVSSAISKKLLFSLGVSRKTQDRDYRIGGSNIFKMSETEKNILDKKSYNDIMTNTQYEISQVNGKLQYQIDKNWSISLQSMMTISNDIETPGNYWHSNGMAKKDINRLATYLDIVRTSSNNELIISPYITSQSESNYDNNTDSTFITSRERIKQYGVKIGNTHTWGNFKWLIGMDFDNYSVGSEKFKAKDVPNNPLRPDNSRMSLSAFTQVAYTWKNLFVNAGIRYNYIDYTLKKNEMLGNAEKNSQYSNVNPSLGITYTFLKNFAAHATVGNAFYVPDAYKSAGVYKIGKKIYVGNPDLKPETVTSFDAGLRYGFKDYINIDATYFQSYYDNKIINDNSRKDTTSYKNANGGVMRGIEVMLSSNIAHLWNAPYSLELFGGLTHYFQTDVDDAGVKKGLLYVRKMTANFGIAFNNNSGFAARFNSRYIGNRLENDYMGDLRPDIKEEHYYTGSGYTAKDKILRHSPHMVFDFSTSYTFKFKMRLGLSISNLFDENYSEKDGYNMPGRSVMGHVTYTF